jgi:hypothetical protein
MLERQTNLFSELVVMLFGDRLGGGDQRDA